MAASEPEQEMIALPTPSGPFSVGRFSVELVDEQRIDPWAPVPGTPRRLVVWIWYPAASGGKPAPYLPDGWEVAGETLGFRTGGFESHCLDGAPAVEGLFAVLLFSASGFSPLSFAALLEELASHGYAVVGINDTHLAPISVFEDGSQVPMNPAVFGGIVAQRTAAESFAFRAGIAEVKTDDLRFVVDQLGTLGGPIAGRLDLARIGTFGHSLGGNAALELMRQDARCQAAANLDGAVWTEAGWRGIEKPALLIATNHSEWTRPCPELVQQGAFPDEDFCRDEIASTLDGWQRIYDTARPGYAAYVPAAKHNNFPDSQFAPLPPGSPLRVVVGDIDPRRMWELTNDCLLRFFDSHLQSAEARSVADSPFPEAIFGPPAAPYRN